MKIEAQIWFHFQDKESRVNACIHRLPVWFPKIFWCCSWKKALHWTGRTYLDRNDIISVKGAALVQLGIKWYRWNKMLTPLWHSCNIFICICCKFVFIETLWCLHKVTSGGIRFRFWHYVHQSITPRRRENPNLGDLWIGYYCVDIYKNVC